MHNDDPLIRWPWGLSLSNQKVLINIYSRNSIDTYWDNGESPFLLDSRGNLIFDLIIDFFWELLV